MTSETQVGPVAAPETERVRRQAVAHPPATPASQRRSGGRLLRFAARQPVGAAGIVVLLIFMFSAALAPLVAPYSPDRMGLGESFASPSLSHPLGLDQLGRDVLSRIIWAGRVSLVAGLGATAAALTVGILVGTMSAYFGGLVDLLVQRVVETINVFPSLVLAMMLVAMFGQSTINIIIALAVAMAPGMTRLVRASVISVRAIPYIEASRALGASDRRVMFHHILPNISGPIMVIGTLAVGGAVTAEAGLAFLGIGGSPNDASWGRMLAQASAEFIRHSPHLAYAPGLAITLLVLSVNFAGDALRESVDPRLRGRRRR